MSDKPVLGRMVVVDGRLTFVRLDEPTMTGKMLSEGGVMGLSGGEPMGEPAKANADAALAPVAQGYQGHEMVLAGGEPMKAVGHE